MRKYRLVLILKSDIKKEAKAKLLEDAASWAGKVEKQEIKELGEKKFAYPIKGQQKGDYIVVEFEGLVNTKEFETKIKVNDDILRHLMIRV